MKKVFLALLAIVFLAGCASTTKVHVNYGNGGRITSISSTADRAWYTEGGMAIGYNNHPDAFTSFNMGLAGLLKGVNLGIGYNYVDGIPQDNTNVTSEGSTASSTGGSASSTGGNAGALSVAAPVQIQGQQQGQLQGQIQGQQQGQAGIGVGIINP